MHAAQLPLHAPSLRAACCTQARHACVAPSGPRCKPPARRFAAAALCHAAMSAFGALGVGAAPPNPNNDVALVSPPSDGVSSLCWSPKQNYLIATSWDNQVRCYEVQPSGASVARASFAHEAPVLASAWHHDGGSVFTAGCDKQAKRWDLGANTQLQVAAHEAPIRHLAWVPELQLLVTGGWDRTLRYWDTRSPSPAHTHTLPERCYALSVAYPLLVAGTAERHIQVFNLAANPGAVYKQLVSPLKYQTRCVAAFPDKTGFLVGSIEGRVAVQHVEDALAAKNFTFKCHRSGDAIHAVNACAFHPTHGTFVTTGSDGCYNFWDKDSKQRLKAMSACGAPIPCGAFSTDGSIFAYAVSYDWSKGAEAHVAATASNAIYLHATQEAECKPRARAPGAVGKR